MSITANDISPFSADMMRIKAREAREKQKESEFLSMLSTINKAAEDGMFEIEFFVDWESNLDNLKKLGYHIEKLERTYLIKWSEY